MRRSDIVREIKSIIATCAPTQPTIDTAEQVLAKLEALGMLPPEIDKTIEKHLCTVNEWEAECEIPEYAFKCNNCTCED